MQRKAIARKAYVPSRLAQQQAQCNSSTVFSLLWPRILGTVLVATAEIEAVGISTVVGDCGILFLLVISPVVFIYRLSIRANWRELTLIGMAAGVGLACYATAIFTHLLCERFCCSTRYRYGPR